MGDDGDLLGEHCGFSYRQEIVAGVYAGQGLLATEYQLLAEHVAFLFDTVDLGRPQDEPAAY